MSEQTGTTIEVRGFIHLNNYFKQKNWPIPLIMDLEKPITGAELAKKLEIPLDQIEIVFINGHAQSLKHTIQPGDRVAFVPPGCPGPYRIHLGFYAKNREDELSS